MKTDSVRSVRNPGSVRDEVVVAADEKTGADHEDHSERDLGDDEAAEQPLLRTSSRMAAPAVVDERSQVDARKPPRRRQAEQQARDESGSDREQQDRAVDRHGVEARQVGRSQGK